jgi:hypothetical protein
MKQKSVDPDWIEGVVVTPAGRRMRPETKKKNLVWLLQRNESAGRPRSPGSEMIDPVGRESATSDLQKIVAKTKDRNRLSGTETGMKNLATRNGPRHKFLKKRGMSKNPLYTIPINRSILHRNQRTLFKSQPTWLKARLLQLSHPEKNPNGEAEKVI